MKILALDAATQALSVAVHDSTAPQAAREHFEIAARAHAARLLPLARELLADAGWALSDLDGLAFGRGPGAFTGLRIAAGFIQGLAYGADLPVAPVSTLQTIAARAFAHHAGDTVRVVQDARMGEIYTADFERTTEGPRALAMERVIEPTALTQSTHCLHAGNGWQVVAQATGKAAPHVCEQWSHAHDMAVLATDVIAAGNGVSADQALPVYVRDDVARKPA